MAKDPSRFQVGNSNIKLKKQLESRLGRARTALACRPCESRVAVASAHRPVTSARPGTLGQDATHRGGAGNIHPAIVAGAHACQSRPGCRQYQGPHEPGIQLRTGTAIISKTTSQVGMPACLRLTMPAKRPGSGLHPGRDDLREGGGYGGTYAMSSLQPCTLQRPWVPPNLQSIDTLQVRNDGGWHGTNSIEMRITT